MADSSITRGNTLPDSSAKADFHNLIDSATVSVSNIINSDLSGSAGITNANLAQITTASKVSGAAITLLTSVPSGAGVLPLANRIDTSVTLTDAATIATDASAGVYFRVTLGDNRTLGEPSNPTNGQTCTWEVIQDGTGSRTLAYNAIFAFGTDVPEPTLSTTASKRDFITARYNSTADKWYVLAVAKGY